MACDFVKECIGKKSKKVIKDDLKITSKSYTRAYPFVFDHGKGNYVYDADGNKFLDMNAGVAVIISGHSNPCISNAIKKQLGKGLHYGFCDFFMELPVKLEKMLAKETGTKNANVFLSNSGTESVEAGIKCAMWNTNRKKLMAFNGCFHGRTLGSLSMTNSKPVQRERFNTCIPVNYSDYAYCYRCPWKKEYGSCSFECVQAFEKKLDRHAKETAVVFIEPVQGENGYIVPPKEFVKGIRKATKDKGVLLASDEVQAGNFRTGKMLASQTLGFKPDIIATAKGLGNGMPIGATIASKKIMNWVPGAHATTMGGNLLSVAAAIANLEYIKKNKLGRKAEKTGNKALKIMNEMKEKHKIIGDARGKGLMLAFEFVKDKKGKGYAIKEREKIVLECYKHKVLVLPAGKSSVRLSPPLTVTEKEMEIALDAIENAVKKIQRKK